MFSKQCRTAKSPHVAFLSWLRKLCTYQLNRLLFKALAFRPKFLSVDQRSQYHEDCCAVNAWHLLLCGRWRIISTFRPSNMQAVQGQIFASTLHLLISLLCLLQVAHGSLQPSCFQINLFGMGVFAVAALVPRVLRKHSEDTFGHH